MSYNFITEKGIFVPDTSDILSGVESEYRAAFGADLVTTPNTPQGVLIAAETQSRIDVLTNICTVANQINPQVAESTFLDSIWALTGGARTPATATIVRDVVLTGQAGAIIPAGAQAKITGTDTTFRLATGVVLDGAGNGTGAFLCDVEGQISCAANSLTSIVTGVLGWETVNNPNAGETGTDEESDEQSRLRRKQTLALQGYGTAEAITSRLYGLDQVRSVSFRENVTNAPAVIDGITLVAHSVWVCVDGATNADVAAALLASKSSGSNWNGATTENVVDQYSGQTYAVKFDRPTPRPVMVEVTITSTSSIIAPVAATKKAIMDFANGLIRAEAGFVLGADVSAFELAGAINVEAPSIYVKLCRVANLSGSPSWGSTVAVALNEKATITETDITVIVL